MTEYRITRHRHRDARHALAAAILSHDEAVAVAAAYELLRAHDAVRTPSNIEIPDFLPRDSFLIDVICRRVRTGRNGPSTQSLTG